MKFATSDPKKRRWTACGSCPACTRRDCGDCINCMDKCKFGGQGIRKQSCVRRRCEQMTSQGSVSTLHSHDSSPSTSPLYRPSTPPYDLPAAKSDEQNLFWKAVAGCIALGTPASDHEDSLCMLANAEEDAGNPLSAYAALRQLSGRSLAPPNRSCRASHGSLPCCLPTSSIEFISIAVWPSQEITPNRSTSC
mmetsp:Transcript_59856/g.133394  ORF Transcript_59856/g.133394 Transcript_59856/m.133394 type:complete len:193 (+) Transcript_59856:48-626(+)